MQCHGGPSALTFALDAADMHAVWGMHAPSICKTVLCIEHLHTADILVAHVALTTTSMLCLTMQWPRHACPQLACPTQHCGSYSSLRKLYLLQVTFGICGDYLGRKKIYLVTLILMIACTIGQCFAATPFKGIG